jgi:hypothetical protein
VRYGDERQRLERVLSPPPLVLDVRPEVVKESAFVHEGANLRQLREVAEG